MLFVLEELVSLASDPEQCVTKKLKSALYRDARMLQILHYMNFIN